MYHRLLLATSLIACIGAVAPVRAATTPPRPTSLSYTFAHGAVVHPRGIQLGLTIHSEDPFNAATNGDYNVSFQARMHQYVLLAGKTAAQIETAFDTVNTLINGSSVANAIPPTYDPHRTTPNTYVILVTTNGICACSTLPPLIYSIAGNTPHYVHLGDFFSYMHPSFPRTPVALRGSWTTTMALALTPKHLLPLTLVSKLALQHGAWVVVSTLGKSFRLTEPSGQWRTEWGAGWTDPLPYSGPVTVSGSLTINSTLTPASSDGIEVAPYGATHKPGTKSTVPVHLCQSCTGYSMPLSGVETLHLSYTQNGQELLKQEITAHLAITLVTGA
ncbi:MAG TPA: hypothetical protein VHB98_07495 [Chloroflexota bacterium]|nr:hypothetical protein [Chloroflexota bacterium]